MEITMKEGIEVVSNHSERMRGLAKQAAIVCFVVGLIVLTALGLASAIDVVLMVFTGLLFAIFLHSLARQFDHVSGLGNTWSLVVVVVLLLLLVAISSWILIPTISVQVGEFQERWPELKTTLRERLQEMIWGDWLLSHVPEFEQLWPQPQNLVFRVTGVATSAVGGLGVPIIVFTLGLMLAAQPSVYTRGLICLIPSSRRKRAEEVLAEISSTLQWWLFAKITAMVVVGVLTWLGLLLFGVPLAATLAVIAAILTFIPNFGPIISAIPAVLLAFMQSPLTALWVVLLYLAIQLLESFVVTPLIQYRALLMPPALVIFAQLAASAWVGVWGLALATPLLAIVVVLVRMLYREDLLHEPAETSTCRDVAG